ncbi:hypothetical protein ABK040_003088 [Willaertia magna]
MCKFKLLIFIISFLLVAFISQSENSLSILNRVDYHTSYGINNEIFLEYYIISDNDNKNYTNNFKTFLEASKEIEKHLKILNSTNIHVNLHLILVSNQIVFNEILLPPDNLEITFNTTLTSFDSYNKSTFETNLISTNYLFAKAISITLQNINFKGNFQTKNPSDIIIINYSEIQGELSIHSKSIVNLVLFENCKFKMITKVILEQINNLNIIKCQFNDLNIYFDSIAIYGINNLLIDNCNFKNLTSLNNFFKITLTFNIIIQNCTVIDNNLNSFLIIENVLSLTMINNIFYNNFINHNFIYLNSIKNINLKNIQFIDNFSKLYSQLIIKQSFITGDNLLFKNCTSNYNGGAMHVETTNGFKIKNSHFLNNKSNGKGGAIYSNISFSEFYLQNCSFIDNTAKISGGAVHCENYELFQNYETNYINNQVTGEYKVISNTQQQQPSSSSQTITTTVNNNEISGLGGALYLSPTKNDICLFSDIQITSLFENNKASKGGVIYLKGFCNKLHEFFDIQNSIRFINNTATIAGGAIYFSTYFDTVFTSQKVIENSYFNNKAIYYGNDIASDVYNVGEFHIFRQNENIKMDRLDIYSGELVTINFNNFTDFFGSNITKIIEPLTIYSSQPYFTINWKVNSTIITTTNTPIYYIYDFNLILKERKVNNSFFPITFQFSTFSLNVTCQLLQCPEGKDLQYDEELNGFICKSLPNITLYIILIILGSILFFTVGIIIGAIIFYGIFIVVKKLRILNKKEKAEKDMEKKMIMIINNEEEENLTQPLLYNNNNVGKKNKYLENIVIPIEDIKVINRIAEGGNGIIYYGFWKTTIEVAIKALKSINSYNDDDVNSNNNSNNTNESDEFEKEASLLAKIRHPNIVNFYGICLTDLSKYMIVEYLKNGDLGKLIYYSKIGKEIITIKKKILLLLDISNGMNYLHELKPYPIIHRDLKPANILLDNNYNAKVCDFGVSKIMSTLSYQSSFTTNVGTLFYMPQESFSQNNDNSLDKIESGRKVDVYSFGIIMWELLFEENPYCNQHSEKLYYFKKDQKIEIVNALSVPLMVREGKRPIIPFENDNEMERWIDLFILSREEEKMNNNLRTIKEVLKEYINLFKMCWSQQPKDRPSFNVIVSKLIQIRNMLQ